jgi:hypothetical protein
MATRERGAHPRRGALGVLGADNLVVLDVLDLGHRADGVDGGGRELARVAADVAVVDVAEAGGGVGGERAARVRGGEEVHVVRDARGVRLGLEDDDVRVVEGPVRVLGRDERGERPAAVRRGRAIGEGRERARRGEGGEAEDEEGGAHGRRRVSPATEGALTSAGAGS